MCPCHAWGTVRGSTAPVPVLASGPVSSRGAWVLAALLAWAAPAGAHPVPFSYLDIHVGAHGLDVSLVAHATDVAHELTIVPPELLLDPARLAIERGRVLALVAPRIGIEIDGRPIAVSWVAVAPLAEPDAVRVDGVAALDAIGSAMRVRAPLFPYDPNHQTFVNVYAGGTLLAQALVDASHPSAAFSTGVRQGPAAILRRLVPEGIRHIAIGPDHILFLVGLLLLGGSVGQLVRIVTAFTVGHSLTLSLAVLGIVSPPSRLVEPAIALSIVYVGLDNLLAARDGRDVRAAVAATFGLVHGFGFASVLKEMGLAPGDVGWSLFSFNAGVELGQLVIVAIVAGVLAAIRRRSPVAAQRLVYVGSCGVAAAGAFWFVQRAFFAGGS